MSSEVLKVQGANSAIGGTFVETSGLGRFIPEPRSSTAVNFRGVLAGAASLLRSGVGAVTGVEPIYQDLLDKQIEMQLQMQLVTLESNIEKSRHETQMAAIRNVRAA